MFHVMITLTALISIPTTLIYDAPLLMQYISGKEKPKKNTVVVRSMYGLLLSEKLYPQ